MKFLKKSLNWRIGYAVCCPIYVGWVVYLSLNNFDMVHSRYQRAVERLQPARIEKIALQELVDQCRKESKRIGRSRQAVDKTLAAPEEACLSWPTAVLEERQEAVEERLVDEQSRTSRKLVLFYVSFGVIFLVLPLIILYLLLSFFIWIFRSVKIVR